MIFDAHGDILTDIYEQELENNKDSFKNRHLQAYKDGGVTHSIFVNWSDPKDGDHHQFDSIVDYGLRHIHENDDIFHVCLNTEDMIKSIQNDKIGVILGIEGLKYLKGVSHIKELYQKGFRHASLTWNEINDYATGLDGEHSGLTSQGIELVQTMEQLGMIIDLAHSNEFTFNDILNHTSAPVIISHGNVKALCNHRRNYTDDQLFKLKERNGVIGICAIKHFLSDLEENQSISFMALHIKYVKDLIGIDHVGLGFDLCYYLSGGPDTNMVEGFQTMSDAKNLAQELKKLDFTDEEIEKVLYKNFFRVIGEILG